MSTIRRQLNATAMMILFLTSTRLIAAEAVHQACYGKHTANERIVYFHGLDPDPPSPQELENRQTLRQLALRNNWQVFVARAHTTCKKRLRCWLQASHDQVQSTLKEALKQSASCFKGKDPTGLLGFSNGGYLVTKVALNCLQPNAWVIAIGSAGSAKIKSKPACNPKINLLIGKRDVTRSKTRLFFHSMQKAGLTRVDINEFDGGHEIKIKALETALKRSINTLKP